MGARERERPGHGGAGLAAALDGFDEIVAAPDAPTTTFIGIDPGQKGYVAGLPASGSEVLWTKPTPTIPTGKGNKHAYDLPAVWSLVLMLPRSSFVLLEQQQPYPNQGGVSNFNTGEGFMLWKMALTAAGMTTGLVWDMVRPQKWKKAMGITVSAEIRSQGKNAATKARKLLAVQLCQRTHPGIDLRDDRRKTDRAKKLCSDKAEAILLADYARRIHGRTN